VEIPNFSAKIQLLLIGKFDFGDFFKMQVISMAFRMAMIGLRELESEQLGIFWWLN
jgi:hypothetical protein